MEGYQTKPIRDSEHRAGDKKNLTAFTPKRHKLVIVMCKVD
jgi:hypothetical protein